MQKSNKFLSNLIENEVKILCNSQNLAFGLFIFPTMKAIKSTVQYFKATLSGNRISVIQNTSMLLMEIADKHRPLITKYDSIINQYSWDHYFIRNKEIEQELGITKKSVKTCLDILQEYRFITYTHLDTFTDPKGNTWINVRFVKPDMARIIGLTQTVSSIVNIIHVVQNWNVDNPQLIKETVGILSKARKYSYEYHPKQDNYKL